MELICIQTDFNYKMCDFFPVAFLSLKAAKEGM